MYTPSFGIPSRALATSTSPTDPTDRRRRASLVCVQALALGGPAMLASTRAWARVEGVQRNWRFCGKCHVMFFDGFDAKGRCAAGGGHASAGHLFKIGYDDSRQVVPGRPRQYDWRACGKCSAMFFDGYPLKGRCPGGGGHIAAGYMFGLAHKVVGGHGQDTWFFCSKCNALYFDGSQNKGHCPAGGGHSAAGINFAVAFDVAASSTSGVRLQIAIAETAEAYVNTHRSMIEAGAGRQLGRGDLIAPGFTLYDISFRLGQLNVAFPSATSFRVEMKGCYLYCKSTQPTVVGASGDPAFELHFDSVVTGMIQIPTGPGAQARIENLSASVPRLHVKPRNVVGGVMTTITALFQLTKPGRIVLENAVRENINEPLTAQIRQRLQSLRLA